MAHGFERDVASVGIRGPVPTGTSVRSRHGRRGCRDPASTAKRRSRDGEPVAIDGAQPVPFGTRERAVAPCVARGRADHAGALASLPIAAKIEAMTPDERSAMIADIARELQDHINDGQLTSPNSSNVAIATA